ncbi:hypothetical protein BLNAU_10953 [Blattamonas nauphoetae]|uniref:Uncharacterized protein n=1 Tax=Blattamonas nauphoetae TaxID=2049346 RepID=A0ABQ9XPZ9_9EUKA|nr:hypothetical protein BLNAU_10953 [Blattamonas nauphoetae]
MPPKHKLSKKNDVPQDTSHGQTVHSNTSNADIVDSSHPDSIETNEEFPINSTHNQSANDFLTILPDDQPYVQFSKQIMQYEMKRRRLHLEPNSDRLHLVGGDIPLQNSITSDWRVVLQDSIASYDLRKGCVSLFEHNQSVTELSSSEVDHTIRFLEYTTMYLHNVPQAPYRFFSDIFDGSSTSTTRMSSLLKILSHPSETLRTVTLAFFSTGYSGWTPKYSHKIAKTDHFTRILSLLTPHEIPFSDTTMDIHRQVTSILFHFFREIDYFSPKPKSPETVASTLQAFCPYLRHLVAHPAFFPWKLPWTTFDSILRKFEKIINTLDSRSSHPELVQFVDEMKNTLSEELASLIGLADQKETAKCLLFDRLDSEDTSEWVKGFECLLAHADEGRQFSDDGIQSIVIFLKRRPGSQRLVFATDGTFTFREKDKLVSSSTLDVRSLWALLTPTQPQHATALVSAAQFVSDWIDFADRIKHFWIGWLSRFFNAVDSSLLPFTPPYFALHARLVDVMCGIMFYFGRCEPDTEFFVSTIARSELSQCYSSTSSEMHFNFSEIDFNYSEMNIIVQKCTLIFQK